LEPGGVGVPWHCRSTSLSKPTMCDGLQKESRPESILLSSCVGYDLAMFGRLGQDEFASIGIELYTWGKAIAA
jgi:hypothetical protein